jgi:glycosyltransferase involved in cell wall biosynthesis
MKIAFVHDWFTVNGGAEKVAKSILKAIGEADVYCLFDFFDDKDREEILNGKRTKTTFLQRIPFCKTLYRNFLPLFPRAIESLDLSEYDLIISSSFSVAKSVKVNKGQIHVSYCHSPMRYAWDMEDQYLSNIRFSLKKIIAKKVFDRIRSWDKRTSDRVTHFIANSNFVSARIKKCYERDSSVLYPPVNTDFFTINENAVKGDYFLVVSRIVGYKKVDLIAEAFRNLPDKKLIVIGDGPDVKDLPNLPNVEHLGYVNKNEMRSYLQSAKAIILAAVEDFGISALEAQACGIPVLALRKAGYLETVVEDKTGLFFNNQQISDIVTVVKNFDELGMKFDSEGIRNHALLFQEDNFITNFKKEINNVLKQNGSQIILR